MSAQAKKPAPRNQATEAYEAIRRMMFLNEIVPGQKLSYRELAEATGLSKTPVIEALKWLELEQLVYHLPNRGYFTPQIDRQEVAELYDLRLLLELHLLPAVMAKLDGPGLARLRAALDAHLAAAQEAYLANRLINDMEYHLTLAGLSGNAVCLNTLRRVFNLLYLKYGANILFSTAMEKVAADHLQVFERVEAHDLAGAQKALSAHLGGVQSHVLRCIDAKLEEKARLGLAAGA